MWGNAIRSINTKISKNFCIFKILNYEISLCNIRSKITKMVRVLNVAEKNDAAKNIADIMSNGRFQRREGHLLNLEFVGAYKKWQACNPVSLFEAPVIMECLDDYQPIKKTLELEVRNTQYLIIWTDGDREGENIGFEIIEVCKNVQANIRVFRARFSEITPQAISRACANLCPPDKRMSDAVNVRRELDLRIGAAFTRFQTLRLSRVFQEVLANKLISYGSCQFPTLGFVVERYKQVQAFIPEAFWKIKVTHKKEDVSTEFSWKRVRLFDHTACLVLYQMCLEEPTARVVDVRSRNKSKWRPQPLDTVELEKLSSRKLRINAKEAMGIAEKLYTKGFISYPRTETTIFPKELDLTSLVEMQSQDQNWGDFARRVLADGPNPRQGTKTDNAHPPIHPTKYTDTLQGNDKRIYELVVRHFLACVSKDAEGRETTIEIDVNNERFAVNGLMIIAKNYLDVYIYERWNAKIVGQYDVNEVFQPSSIEMAEGETSAPELLTEADLIGLMEKHGIGTDATHAEHIETIKSRLYVGLNENNRFVPGELGMGLVEGYDLMGFQMSKPHLRAELEADLKRITEGTKNPEVVLREQVLKYKECFIEVVRQAAKLDSALSTYLDTSPSEINVENNVLSEPMIIMKCPKCQTGDIVLRSKKDNKGFFLSCLSYPSCNAVIWLPQSLEEISIVDEECEKCQPQKVKKLKFKFKSGSLMPFFPDSFVNCLGGCDSEFMDVIDVHPITASTTNLGNGSTTSPVISRNASSDSGYESNQNTASNAFHNSSAFSRSQSVSSTRQSFPQNSHSSNRQLPRQNNAGHSADLDIVCNCGKKAIVLTVRKEGANKGRQFYKCPEMADDTKCNFFLWKDDENSAVPSTNFRQNDHSNNKQDVSNTRSSISNSNLNAGGAPICSCSEEAVQRTVVKEGNNKGRHFYVCRKPRGESCQFFLWADDVDAFPQSQSTGFARPSTSGPRRRQAGSSSGGPPSKRKCGICSQPGHNRKNCPTNR